MRKKISKNSENVWIQFFKNENSRILLQLTQKQSESHFSGATRKFIKLARHEQKYIPPSG